MGMRLARWLVGVLVIVGLVVLVITVLADPSEIDSELSGATVTAMPERRTLSNEIVVQGIVAYPVTATYRTLLGGVVSAVGAETGQVVDAGEELLDVEGRPVVAVAGGRTFWRELRRGDRGDDVAQLQQILTDAGLYQGMVDGRFETTTEAALKEWQRDHDYAVADGVLFPDDMAVGEWPARVAAVHVAPRHVLLPGEPVVSFSTMTAGVVARVTPTDRLQIVEGMPASVTFAAVGLTDEGVVAELGDALVGDDPSSRGYDMTISGLDLGGVPEGAAATVAVIITRVEDALAVPVVSIVPDADGDPAVVVISPDGGRQVVPVTLGVSDGAFVEVVKGLDGSESVLLGEP